ncbi:MAG: hypothetical protein AAGJ97_02650 [Planctomycetota bacterium]
MSVGILSLLLVVTVGLGVVIAIGFGLMCVIDAMLNQSRPEANGVASEAVYAGTKTRPRPPASRRLNFSSVAIVAVAGLLAAGLVATRYGMLAVSGGDRPLRDVVALRPSIDGPVPPASVGAEPMPNVLQPSGIRPVFKPVNEVPETMPKWVRRGLEHDADATVIVRDSSTVRGRQFADKDEAAASMRARAADVLLQDASGVEQLNTDGRRRLDRLVANAVGETYFERIERSSGENSFTVWRAHGRIDDVSSWRGKLDRRVVEIVSEQRAGGVLFLAGVWVVFGGGLTWLLRGKTRLGAATMGLALFGVGLVISLVA